MEGIKSLLINILEEHYGNLDNCVKQLGKAEQILDKIRTLVN